MTLTTHAIAGAAVATIFPEHPVAGFFAGFASHFLLDAIPHWNFIPSSIQNRDDIDKVSMPFTTQFFKEMVFVAFDFVLGFAVAFALFGRAPHALVAALAGAVGGTLPDALHFAYYKIKIEPLRSIEIFHDRIQSDDSLQRRPALGVLVQLLIIGAIIAGHALLV